MNILVQQHDVIVNVTDSIYWESQIREEFQFVELFRHFSLKSFALYRVTVARCKSFRNRLATNEAVMRNFMQIRLRVDVVKLFVVVNALEAEITPVNTLSVNAIHNRVLNAKITKKFNFVNIMRQIWSNLSHGANSGSILGHGSPRSALRVKAAPSASDSKQYPPSSTTATRPDASDISEDKRCV